ncbi:MAG: hypothetical protein J3K34DRAFT_512345 [Monoraphidium minutum]|nr:MAG: hypothetical protein J3K34DRAFT_512345 [Monoraphidium minutum]
MEGHALVVLLLTILATSTLAQPGSVSRTVRVQDAQQLRDALEEHACTPGVPLSLHVARNISLARGGAAALPPLRIARRVTLWGAGPPRATEIDLAAVAGGWQLLPGATVALHNLTLSNLAPRPAGAAAPPAANVSVLNFPLWFFDTDRTRPQLLLRDALLIVPLDELLVLQHVCIEVGGGGGSDPADVFRYFERLVYGSIAGLEVHSSKLGCIAVAAGAGLGLGMTNVEIGYHRNHFPITVNTSRLLLSNPMHIAAAAAAGAPPGGGAARPPMPAWAAGLAAAAAALALLLAAATAWALLARRGRAAAASDDLGGKGASGSGDALGKGGGGGDEALLEEGALPPRRGGRFARAAAAAAPHGKAQRDFIHEPSLEATCSQAGGSGTTPGSCSGSARGAAAALARGGAPAGGAGAAGGAAARRAAARSELEAAVVDLNHIVDDRYLEIHELLGRGGYGTVYRGTWRNLPVAVKTVVFQDKAAGGEKAQKRAITEAAITSSISHPNVVATLSYDLQPLAAPAGGGAALRVGAAVGPAAGRGAAEGEVPEWKLFLVQEYCNGGSLRQAVDGRAIYWDSDQHQPRVREILATALDIATGMDHIHSKSIIHGDLTPNNVLLCTELCAPGAAAAATAAAGDGAAAASGVSRRPSFSLDETAAALLRSGAGSASGGRGAPLEVRRTAKIADFGLSVRIPEGASHVSNMRQGTPFYVAPEVVKRGTMTKACDVYSFGVVCWELYHGKRPYKVTAARGRVRRRGFPFFSTRCPLRFALLATACMARDASARPQFARVRQEIAQIIHMLPAISRDLGGGGDDLGLPDHHPLAAGAGASSGSGGPAGGRAAGAGASGELRTADSFAVVSSNSSAGRGWGGGASESSSGDGRSARGGASSSDSSGASSDGGSSSDDGDDGDSGGGRGGRSAAAAAASPTYEI